ncbi:NACHT, LRR and PYD domains-containing protein 12-like [Clupea harengus]|uniref:NACHT, LRR and PYD domains-containing protein 12-like n=1 Tax=Clupea harengus TaxID=7950 RepID=A0A8M1K6D2_CLUHA|nr:NACHT, LRR and PYD domains-containing protein 12-like [Clupea harengus]
MGKRRKLQDIYTELCIIEGTTGVNNVHEVAAMQLRQMETRTCSGNSVELSNIFSDHYQTDEPAKKVLTLGIAGVGKTVAVQKFVLDWAENTNYEDIELVFVLPFRELNKHKDDNCTLSDLLLKFYPELELRESTKLKGAVLFVFDGLDESRLELDLKKFICDPKEKSPVAILITSLITGKMLPSAFIWVTTRPAAAKKDLCDLFDRVTEVQGFNEHQREEYLQKIIPEKAEQVITLLKKMRSLYIMCQIPVVCQITAIVLGETREEQKEIPKNLTEIYTQFCVFQINRMNDRYPEDKKMSAEEKGQLLVKLGKLAFKYLEKDTLIFYEKDLAECGINLKLGAQQSGLCTQIFKKENTISGESMFSFVHLTVQEFLAALYMLHSHATDKVNLLIKTWSMEWIFWWFKNSRFDLYKMSLNRALQSQNGHLDLCVRFLLGLAPMLEPKITHPLNLWLPKLAVRDVSIKKTVQYIKEKIGEDKSPERLINLFHCLNELGDNSLVEEINRKMKSAGKEMNLTPAQCSALAYLLLMSAEKLDEFDLKKYLRSEEGLRRMLPVVKVSKRVWLNQCHLYKESCEMMASVLKGFQSSESHLRELDMSGNDLQDEGFDLLCEGLTHPRCKLEKLRLADCNLSQRSCKIVTSALQSENSPLRDVDLGDNDLQKSGGLLLSALQSPNCKLETLRLAGCKLTGRVLALTLQGANPHLRELNISDSELQDCEGELLQQPLNQDCKIRLIGCNLTHTSSAVVTSVLQSFISQLSGLDMSGCDLQTSEEKLLSGLRNPNCQLKTLGLKGCKLTDESHKIVASILLSATSLLELDLGDNELGDSGVQLLSKGLSSPHCKLQALRLTACKLTHKSCTIVATCLQSATSLLELDLGDNELGDSGVQLLSKGLSSPHCKLQTLRLSGCLITHKGCSFLASALKSNPSYLKELDLNNNHLGYSGVRELTYTLNDQNSKLETFR